MPKSRRGSEMIKKLAASPLLTLTATTDDKGNLYGKDLQERSCPSPQEKGFEISADQVGLDGPIKVTGFYSIPIRLFEGAEGKVDITVDRG